MKTIFNFRDDLIDKEVVEKLSKEVSSYIIEQVKHNMNNSNEEIIMKPFNLEEYLKNPSRKVVTRDGDNVRIICTDRESTFYPIIALIKMECGEENAAYTKDGKYYLGGSDDDLFFAPKKHEGWVNLYRNSDNEPYCIGNIYDSEEEAINNRAETAIATVKIEWEE